MTRQFMVPHFEEFCGIYRLSGILWIVKCRKLQYIEHDGGQKECIENFDEKLIGKWYLTNLKRAGRITLRFIFGNSLYKWEENESFLKSSYTGSDESLYCTNRQVV